MDFKIVLEQLPQDVSTWLSSLQPQEVIGIFINAYKNRRLIEAKTAETKMPSSKTAETVMPSSKTTETVMPSNKTTETVMTSADIGISGERFVYSILSKKYTVVCTGKSKNTGDFIVTVDGMRFIIEVKKYSKSVPSAEIEKLYRDMECSTSVNGGLMISLTSRITGITKTMDYNHQLINGHMTPIVFLTTHNISEIKTIEACVYASIDILSAECKSKQRCIDVEGDISDTVADISQYVDDLSRSRNIISETQSIVNKQLMKLALSITTAEVNIKNSINTLQSKIHETHVVPVDNKTIVNDLKIKDSKLIILLKRVIEGISILSDSKNTLRSENKKLTIKIKTTSITVNISITSMDISTISSINGQWTYNGKILSIELTENTIQLLIDLIRLHVLQSTL